MKPFYCPSCRFQGVEAGECSCGDGPLVDVRTQRGRDFVEDVEQRAKDRHERIRRWLAVPFAAGTLIGLWLLPPYREFAAHTRFPFFLDQILTVGAIGVGWMKVFAWLRPFRSHLGVLVETTPNQG